MAFSLVPDPSIARAACGAGLLLVLPMAFWVLDLVSLLGPTRILLVLMVAMTPLLVLAALAGWPLPLGIFTTLFSSWPLHEAGLFIRFNSIRLA